jgi:hypothetical protein
LALFQEAIETYQIKQFVMHPTISCGANIFETYMGKQCIEQFVAGQMQE